MKKGDFGMKKIYVRPLATIVEHSIMDGVCDAALTTSPWTNEDPNDRGHGADTSNEHVGGSWENIWNE